jgi:transposase
MITKKTRIKHAPEFKAEVLKLADKVGVAAAARQLSLKKDAKISDREKELATENTKLKRLLAEQAEELDIVKKAATYVAKNLK